MQTGNSVNEIPATPQADGDARPFGAFDSEGPVRVHVEKSGPAFRIEQRNLAIDALVEPMAKLLYRAMQVQALGVVDHVTFENLPPRVKDQLVADARTALHLQSSLYRELATRKAKHTFQDAIKDAAYHYPVLNPCADHREQDRRAEAMQHVATFMELLDIPTLMLGAYKRALTEPLPSSPASQVVRTALRGVCDGF